MGAFAEFRRISLTESVMQLRDGGSRLGHIVTAQLLQNAGLSCRSLLQATKNVAI